MTFLADDKVIFNKKWFEFGHDFKTWLTLRSRKVFCINFQKNVNRIIEPTDCKTWYHRISRQTKRHVVCMPSTSRTTENVMLLKHTYWVKKTDLTPTEQFLEHSEKLIFHDRNDVIIFSEKCIFYMLESSKFVGSNLNKHNFGSCWSNSIKFSGEFDNLSL